MTRKTGLGRGLDALIPAATQAETVGISQVETSSVSSNPRQPRTRFDPDELTELAASIQEVGILQPLIVTRAEEPDRYLLVAGERRLMAARQAGLQRVPVIVREATDQQRLELALIENVQRADLGPLEAAEAFRQLADDFHLSHEEIALRVAKSRVAVTNTLRLLKLPSAVQQALADGQISEGHARALLALRTPEAQAAVLHTILKKDLTVRQTEALVRQFGGERPVVRPASPVSPEIAALENRLEAALGTRVEMRQRQNGGTITIRFYSNEELNSLVEKLLGEISDS